MHIYAHVEYTALNFARIFLKISLVNFWSRARIREQSVMIIIVAIKWIIMSLSLINTQLI